MSSERLIDSPPPECSKSVCRLTYSKIPFPLICSAVFLICVGLTKPFTDSGFDDDWSYSHVALKLAETGGLHYNGWGSPMLLPQVLWGAAWIRLFGFSFDVLRFATLPFSLGFVLLVYALGRKIGLRSQLALFGSLTVGTSPLFLPLAASFMTEAYACFFTMLCIYAAICSAEARNNFPATLWLWVLAISGIVGGSDRQTVWVAPIALIPYLFWVKRLDRRFALHAVVAYVVCIVSIAVLLTKFSQPYAPLEIPRGELIQFVLHHLPSALAWMMSTVLSCLLVSLPALLFVSPLWKTLGVARHKASGLISAASVVFLLGVFIAFGLGPFGLAPFAGNVLSQSGILYPAQVALGFHPDTLPLWLRLGLTWGLAFSVITFAYLCKNKNICTPPPRVPAAVFTIFTCAYALFLFPGALESFIYDRYMLPLFPLLVLSIMLLFQSRVRSVPMLAWAFLVVFAAYGVATTHDYFAASRARVLAAQTLEKSGIPRTHISAGYEYDGWTQLQVTGNITGTKYGDPMQVDASTFWFWRYTTALQPDYVVEYAQGLKAVNGLPSLSFETWLPPFRRYVSVLKRADLPKAAEASGR